MPDTDPLAQALSRIASFDQKPAKPMPPQTSTPTPVIASVPIDHHPEGDRDLLPERAIVTHVLFVVHGVDHAARAEEQQRLEEGVGEQMEHRRAVSADARGEEHVAELRAGRISDHPLDVVLGAADGRGEDAGRGADIGDDVHRGRRRLEHRRQAADHEHAGGDHRRGVDQGADRGRALHRVGQPGVEAAAAPTCPSRRRTAAGTARSWCRRACRQSRWSIRPCPARRRGSPGSTPCRTPGRCRKCRGRSRNRRCG